MNLAGSHWRSIAVVLATVAAAVVAPVTASAATSPVVVPIDSTYQGKTYGEWSEAWWQWAAARRSFSHCPAESGPVYFLSAPADTSCVVPPHRGILFPAFTAEWSVAEANLWEQQHPGQTCPVPASPSGTDYDALLACAGAQADYATHPNSQLTATVDGQAVPDLTGYRAASPPPPFTLRPVRGNLVGIPDEASGRRTEAVSDGFWILLEPLPRGEHTITFGASIPDLQLNFSATYRLRVL
ncbi:MAG TPA: hypothetical protein VJT49_12395 [Amycolatopsis sp.]|uniref:hypothetical protein n=1 Tax=Amycolatopsis sp. TaxID=37632 RepID=UPI002B4634AA|nr:hypothetical protein [Amycolatopsis sp.]HKS45887.1 hypothetical protein [Amycolatopsis sp.]